jgi:hypothetical protein
VGAFLLGAIFVLLPMTQHLLRMMMSDPLVALLTLGATSGDPHIACCRVYAVVTGVTILTKGTGSRWS